MNLRKIRLLGYNLSEVCNYCVLSSIDNSAVSLDLVLIQSGKNLFCWVFFFSYSGLSQGEAQSEVPQMDFFNIEEFVSALIL